MAKPRDIEALQCDMPYARAAAHIVAVRAQELFAHAAGVLDVTDIERVHDMRVATRRLRAVLEIFAPCFPAGEHKAVLRDVKRLADALGARRDPDVQLAALERFEQATAKADAPGIEAFAGRPSRGAGGRQRRAGRRAGRGRGGRAGGAARAARFGGRGPRGGAGSGGARSGGARRGGARGDAPAAEIPVADAPAAEAPAA
jgi:hypothetical protein